MSNPLFDTPSIDVSPLEFLESAGQITRTFGLHTQDSGNDSYIIAIHDESYFVKTAGDPAYSDPLRPFDGRVKLLRNTVRLRQSCDHPNLPILHNTIESPRGPLLVYECVEGDLLSSSKTDPTSLQSFPFDAS